MSVFMVYLKDRVKYLTPIRTREEYLAHRDSAAQRMIMGKVRKGNEKMKGSLVQMVYSCLPNEDGTLKKSKHMSSTIAMDVDHIPAEEMEPTKQRILEKKDELGLLMLEISARGEGYHLVFRRRPELSQEDNLKWASKLLGVKFDSGAQDITRVFYTTTNKELLFLDDRIFEVQEVQEVQSLNDNDNDNDNLNENKNENKFSNSQILDKKTCQLSTLNSQLEYKGVSFQQIIEAWSKQRFSEAGASRHGASVALARDLYIMTDRDKAKTLSLLLAQPWVQEIIQERKENVERTVNDAAEYVAAQESENAKKGKAWLPKISKEMSEALTAVGAVDNSQCIMHNSELTDNSSAVPPAMPAKLPKLIELLTKNVPDIYKPAVANAVFPALAAHLHGVKFRYWDNVEHEATFMNVLIGRQSIGKGCIKKPIEYIMEDIRLRDMPNRQREAEWKQKNPGSKPKKDPRPTDICIQMLIDNLTDAVFNQRIVDANNNGERYIFTIVDEIEALKKVTSKNTVDEVGLLIRKAFDNSLAGQERVGADSVSGIAPLRWNFNASTTPPNARRFFHKMVNDGTVSRLDISTIILKNDEDDDEIVQGIYDDDFAKELKPYIDRLEAANGMIECPQAKKLSLDIRQENREAAKLYDSEAYRVFSYRANVIAWLKGMLLYVAHGYKWSKDIAEFVRWSQKYNLWCKMLYFGQQLEYELREEIDIQRQSGPQNMLDLLPDTFTREQYYRIRQSQKRSGNGNSTLRVWQTRGYITQEEDGNRFNKTEKYKHRSV